MGQGRSVAGIFAGYGLAFVVFAIWGGFRGYDREPALVLGTFAVTLVLAVAAQFVAFRMSPGLPSKTLLVFIVATPFLMLVWKIGYSSLFDGATRWWPSKPGFRCLLLSTAVGAAALLPAIWARKGAKAAGPVATGAAFGSAAAAVAWTLVDLWCPVGHLDHMLLGHVLPTLLLSAAGGLLGRFIFELGAGKGGEA